MFTKLAGRAFGVHNIFIYMNTFPEKWNKIILFNFKKYELEYSGYFAFLSKLAAICNNLSVSR